MTQVAKKAKEKYYKDKGFVPPFNQKIRLFNSIHPAAFKNCGKGRFLLLLYKQYLWFKHYFLLIEKQ